MKKKVLVIGLDGASLDIIQSAINKGKMPFCEQILSEGGELSKLKSTIPPSTAPAWSSMMTGVNPGKHGVYDFLVHKGLESRPATINDVKKPFVWDILAKCGLKSVVIGHPLTYPVRHNENIVMVSGILAPTLNENAVYPHDVLGILESEGYHIDIEDKMPILKSSPEMALEICNESVLRRLNAAKRILKDYEWDFAFILFPEPDRLLHYHINKENIVLDHFKCLDEAIKKLADLDDCILFIVSDHGFTRIRRIFAVNSFLYQLGLLKVYGADKRGWLLKLYGKIPKNKLVLKLLSKIEWKFNWDGEMRILKEKSIAWFTPYAESGIRLVNECAKKDSVVNDLVEALNNLVDPKTEENVVRAFKREEIFWGDQVSKAPDIVLLPLKNFIHTHVIPSKLGEWFFDPDELFLKEGDHVCEEGLDGVMLVHGIKIAYDGIPKVWDLAPTIMELFGLKLNRYSYFDGNSLLR